MGLEEGSMENNKKQPVKSEQDKLIEKLLAEVEILKQKSAQAPVAINGGGMSPEQFAAFLKAAKEKDKDLAWDSAVDMDQIDPDDYLDEPVKFTAPFVFWVIVEDIKQGRRIKLPNNKREIKFTHAGTKYVKDGINMRQNNISRYFSSSKKEVAWLRAHWEYGVKFYESDKEAMDADGIKLVKLSRIFQGLQTMDPIKIFGLAKEYGLKTNEDANVTRVALANKMVEKELEVELGYTTKRLAETKNEELVYEKCARD